MTATRSERGLDDGEVAREYADAEVLANALEYFRAGRYAGAEAEAAYATILEHEPGHFICLHHLGLITHARGEHTAAARLIEQALAINPDYVEAIDSSGARRYRSGGCRGAAGDRLRAGIRASARISPLTL
jgi:Tfp pilus assembly protein PilF